MIRHRTLLTALLLTLMLGGVHSAVPPLIDAASRGDTDTVRTLLRQGADVNEAQGDGMTALHWASEIGDAELASGLLYAGINLEAGTRIGNYTPGLPASWDETRGPPRPAAQRPSAGSWMAAPMSRPAISSGDRRH